MDNYLGNIQTSYDTVATSYSQRVQDAADGENLALDLLVTAGGPVLDAGCGPGRVARRLHEPGVNVMGVDLSPGMIEVAEGAHPGIDFRVGSITQLELPDATFAGVICWWSIIHLPRSVVPQAIAEFHRVLAPGGGLLLGFHLGTGSTHKTSGYGGHAMDVHVHRWQRDELTQLSVAAGVTPHSAALPDDVLCFTKPAR